MKILNFKRNLMYAKFQRMPRWMFTIFTDGAALLWLINRVDTLRDSTVGHHTVYLVIWFAAAPFTGRRLWAERERRNLGQMIHFVLPYCVCAGMSVCYNKKKHELWKANDIIGKNTQVQIQKFFSQCGNISWFFCLWFCVTLFFHKIRSEAILWNDM